MDENNPQQPQMSDKLNNIYGGQNQEDTMSLNEANTQPTPETTPMPAPESPFQPGPNPYQQNEMQPEPTVDSPGINSFNEPPMPPVESKSSKSMIPTIVTIILLIFAWIIGVIVMWVWPKWSKKTKIIVTVVTLLIQLILVTVLSVTVFSALNPVQRFSEGRDSTRMTDVSTILNAIRAYTIDSDGILPPGIDPDDYAEYQIGTCTTGGDILCPNAETACKDIYKDLVEHINAGPVDIAEGASNETTGYSMKINSDNTITVSACLQENNSPTGIEATIDIPVSTKSNTVPTDLDENAMEFEDTDTSAPDMEEGFDSGVTEGIEDSNMEEDMNDSSMPSDPTTQPGPGTTDTTESEDVESEGFAE